jgi:hypothetical protein
MGMDVCGNLPASGKGAYFRNNSWWWHPLWEYCEEIAPDLIPAGNPGHTNDHWGLDEEASLSLADRLAAALASGETQRHAEHYAAYFKPSFPFTVANVRAFEAFLRDCGGFRIG